MAMSVPTTSDLKPADKCFARKRTSLITLWVSIMALTLTGCEGGELEGTCFWYNLSRPAEGFSFTDAELSTLLTQAGSFNCTSGSLQNETMTASASAQTESWLVFVVDEVVQSSVGDAIRVTNMSRLIMTATSSSSVECRMQPNFYFIDRSRILNGSFGSQYSINRTENKCLVTISDSTDIILTGLTFRLCLSNDLEPAALSIVGSSNVHINNCTLRENFGPAASIINSSAILTDVEFVDNIRFGSVHGAMQFLPNQGCSGLVVVVLDRRFPAVKIQNCSFRGNINTQTEVDLDAQFRGGHSGALTVHIVDTRLGADVAIVGTTFEKNAARQFGGGLFASLYSSQNASLLVENCSFIENEAETIGGGMVISIANHSQENTIRVVNTPFHGNIAGIGGGLVITLFSKNTVYRTFDEHFYEYAQTLINESFPVAVPSENDVSIVGCRFVANAARGSGSSMGLLMVYPLTTSPLPVILRNCEFRDHGPWPSSPYVPADNSLYELVKSLVYSPQYTDGRNLRRFYRWTTASCVFICDQMPAMLDVGYTRFISNNIRATIIRGTALYITGMVELTANINSHFNGFNLNSYGAGIVLLDRAQVYVTNSSQLIINNNFAAFGAGLYSLSSLTSAAIATANNDIFSHRCFVIFSSQSFTYASAADSSQASFRFENNTAWKGAAIYSSSMLECSGWWRSRNCIQDYPKKQFLFANNSACDFEGFLPYGRCLQRATELAKVKKTPCVNLTVTEALASNQVHCQSVATDAFEENWVLQNISSTSGHDVLVSPGQTIDVRATLMDQNCNPSELNAKLQANPQDVLDFHHLHFKVNGVSDLTFQAYSADYKFYDAGSHQHRSVEVSLQPQVATFEQFDVIKMTIGQCRAGYLPNATVAGHKQYTCVCLGTSNILKACVEGDSGVVVKAGVWASNSSADGNFTSHACPYGFCKPYCGQNKSSAIYGVGECCEETAGHRGCFFDSTKPNSLCNTNREGILCGKCSEGHGIAHSQWVSTCKQCPHRPGLLVIPIILVSGFVILLIVLEIQLPYLVWVFVHYIQVSSFLPNSFNDKLFNVILYLQFYTSLDFLYGACVFGSMTMLQNSALYFLSFGIAAVVIAGVFLVTAVAYRKHRRQWFRRCRTAFLTCFQLTYFNMWLGCLNILLCVDISFERGVEKRLFGDGTELCWQGTHLKYAIPTILFVGLVLVPAPFLLALFNYKVANSDNQLKKKNWFGYDIDIGASWWFSWDMVRKMAVIADYAVFEVSIRQSVRLIILCFDLVLTTLCNSYHNGNMENKKNLLLSPGLSLLQGLSLLLLSLMQLLWVAFFLTSRDPHLPLGLLSFLESIPIVLIGLWLIWKVIMWLYRKKVSRKENLDEDEDMSWAEYSTVPERSLSVHQRVFRRITHSVSLLATGPAGQQRRVNSQDNDGYLRPIDSDVLLAGRAPAYHKRRRHGANDSSDSDTYVEHDNE